MAAIFQDAKDQQPCTASYRKLHSKSHPKPYPNTNIKLKRTKLNLKVLSTHLHIGSAHNKAGTTQIRHCPNFASFELFLNRKSGLYSYTTIANQNSVRYSVSISYFINIAVQNVNKAFVYITSGQHF